MMAERNRSLADGRPDPAADWPQAEAVLVLRPDLDRPVGMRRPGLGDSGIEPPLKAARCSGVAARGCCGRAAGAPPPSRDVAPSRAAPLGRPTAPPPPGA